MNKHGHIMDPSIYSLSGIWAHPKLSRLEKDTLNLINRMVYSADGPCSVYTQTLAERLYVSPRQVQRALVVLRMFGYIEEQKETTHKGTERIIGIPENLMSRLLCYQWLYALAFGDAGRTKEWGGLRELSRWTLHQLNGAAQANVQRWEKTEATKWILFKEQEYMKVDGEIHEEGTKVLVGKGEDKSVVFVHAPKRGGDIDVTKSMTETTPSPCQKRHQVHDSNVTHNKDIYKDLDKDLDKVHGILLDPMPPNSQKTTTPLFKSGNGELHSEEEKKARPKEKEESFSSARACVRVGDVEWFPPDNLAPFALWVKRCMVFARRNNPSHKFKNMMKRIQDGCSTIEKLVRRDGYVFESAILPAVEWGLRHHFWKKQLMSLAPLRNRAKNGNLKFENLLSAYEEDISPQTTKPRITAENFGIHTDGCLQQPLPEGSRHLEGVPLSAKEALALRGASDGN